MNFANLFFIFLFFPLCLIFYFISPNVKYRNAVLIVFSLLFYSRGGIGALAFILVYTVINYVLGILIGKFHEKKWDKVLIFTGLALDLGLLLVLKYTGFFVDNVNEIFHLSITNPDLMLPLGISFFTFRTVAYIVDVYWEKHTPEKNFADFLMFISLFPCTVAGPIVRYQTIGEELHKRETKLDDLYEGATRFCVGLAKKVMLADNCLALAEAYWGETLAGVTFTETCFSLLCYTLYVYFDFSGYSDMAIGIGRIFGFHFEENFRYPFVCTTISEFWQRWHISLGSFFRDYLLYVPIFGKIRRYGGLFLVWFSTGLWHGASWNYIIWGLYFGLFIFIETLIGKKKMKKIPVAIRHIYTKLVILIGFGIFYCTDMKNLGLFFRSIIGLNGFGSDMLSIYFVNNIVLIVAAVAATFPIVPWIKKKIEGHAALKNSFTIVWSVYCLALFAVSFALLVSSTSAPFLYAQF